METHKRYIGPSGTHLRIVDRNTAFRQHRKGGKASPVDRRRTVVPTTFTPLRQSTIPSLLWRK